MSVQTLLIVYLTRGDVGGISNFPSVTRLAFGAAIPVCIGAAIPMCIGEAIPVLGQPFLYPGVFVVCWGHRTTRLQYYC